MSEEEKSESLVLLVISLVGFAVMIALHYLGISSEEILNLVGPWRFF